MGARFVRRVKDLGASLILAPERFDPRREMAGGADRRLDELVAIVTASASPRAFAPDRPVLVLDTAHAFEGFVIARQDPAAPQAIGSAKRRLAPGDVIISRLRPYLRQVAYVDEDLFRLAPGGNEVAASSEFVVLRGHGEIEPAALVPFLLSASVQAALAAGQEGGHHPRVPRELIGALRVPAEALDGAKAIAADVRSLTRALRRSLAGRAAQVKAIDAQMRVASNITARRAKNADATPRRMRTR
ncbi:MAG: hypothetical protein U0359_29605 [Byssovorax sp.]